MAIISNLFSIEDNLVAQLELLAEFKAIYHQAITEDLNESNIEMPALLISSKGVLSGSSAVRVKHQKIITLWEIAIACQRENYKTVGGLQIITVIKHLNGYQADDWINPARLVTEKDKSEPVYQGSLALFPLLFEVEIVV